MKDNHPMHLVKNTITIPDILTHYNRDIAARMEHVLTRMIPHWQREFNNVSPRVGALLPLLTDLFHGGKKMRGTMVHLGYRLTGAADNDTIINACVAYEIFHAAVLVHDDVIDKSDTRRGRETIHLALQKKKHGNAHYGLSQAICLGDAGFFMADALVLGAGFNAAVTVRAMRLFSQSRLTTVMGEMLDIDLSVSATRTEDDLLSIMRHKTAHYSFIDPLHMGAMLGGGDDTLIDIIRDFGAELGMGLQIKDDINGIFASLDQTGKSNLTDIMEGKLTYLSLYAQTHASVADLDILRQVYGNENITDKEAAIVRDIFRRCGALDHAEQKLHARLEAARTLIAQLPSVQHDLLHALVAYVHGYR